MLSFRLINHASLQVCDEKASFLSDSWCKGNIFDDGWSLLCENLDEDTIELFNITTCVWISHEHPGHFIVSFFKKFSHLILKNETKVLFQNTSDKRVLKFLKK